MQLQDIQNDDGYLFLLELVKSDFNHGLNLDEVFSTVKNTDRDWASATAELADKLGCMDEITSFIHNSPQEWFDYSEIDGVPIRNNYAAQRRYGVFGIIISHLGK